MIDFLAGFAAGAAVFPAVVLLMLLTGSRNCNEDFCWVPEVTDDRRSGDWQAR